MTKKNTTQVPENSLIEEQFTKEQLEFVLAEIVMFARSANIICGQIYGDLCQHHNSDEEQARVMAMEGLIRQIGLLAEHYHDNAGCNYGGVPGWLLPQSFRLYAKVSAPQLIDA